VLRRECKICLTESLSVHRCRKTENI